MFEDQLAEKFKKIFDVKKVSYDEPGESAEQECLFIEVENSHNVIKDDRAKAMVTGNAVIFSTAGKLPFGYFSKKIQESDPEDTRDIMFFDFESNTRRFRDKVQRGFSFIYFFDSQYNPARGSITSIEITEE